MSGPDVPPAHRSTLDRISLTILPPAVRRFLFSHSDQLHLALRCAFGAVSGTGLFLGLSGRLRVTFDLQRLIGVVFVAVCSLGGATSSSCRCFYLLVFPSMLGSRGRTYLMVVILSVLCRGPLANIQRNVASAALSVSCNLDLQVGHSKLLWRNAIRPVVMVTEELMDSEAEFQSEALSVGEKFQNIRDEVLLQYGYDRFSPEHGAGNSTQEQFSAKTMRQCDSVVDEGVQRCADWFSLRWAECMEAIPVPVINHILCVSMKFHFLCDVMRVMTPWCRDQIPVEGNFGQLFDKLNLSVARLSKEFSAELVLQEEEQRSLLGGALSDQEFTQAARGSLQNLAAAAEQLLDGLELLLSFTFVSMLAQAFGYIRRFRRDIRYDNVYVTAYFRRIDARRRRLGKSSLLPLNQSEKFIDPWSPKIHPDELKQLTSGVFQVLSVTLLSVVLLTVDFSLFHVLDIVSRHTFTQFNLTSHHEVDIKVGGASMMARLLRKTISAFNSSSSLNIQADNQSVYLSCVCCILLLVLFSCLQVYTNRLRRVIAAAYHPEREKKRVLFLYNLLIQRRTSCADRKCTLSREQGSGWMQRLQVCDCRSRCERCLCCHHHHQQQQEASDSEETHYGVS